MGNPAPFFGSQTPNRARIAITSQEVNALSPIFATEGVPIHFGIRISAGATASSPEREPWGRGPAGGAFPVSAFRVVGGIDPPMARPARSHRAERTPGKGGWPPTKPGLLKPGTPAGAADDGWLCGRRRSTRVRRSRCAGFRTPLDCPIDTRSLIRPRYRFR